MKKITFLLLVILFVGSSNYSSSQTPLTDANINEAVDLWVSDQTVAESTYGHISNWDTSSITDMFALFYGKTSFNDNIGNWDVSNVTDMFAMFEKATSFNQPIDNWNVSNVTDMYRMFSRALSFNQSISSWDVSNVTNMSYMFGTAFTETSSFNQPIGNWDVGSVTDMSVMFSNSPFNQPIGEWNVSSVTEMDGMFNIATSFDQPIGNWDVGNITKMSYMFFSATSFNQPIDNWNVTNVTSMYGVFQNATSFNQPINSWDVSNVYDMSSMFNAAESFNQPIDNWNVTNVSDMKRLFKNAISFNQPIGSWDVSNVHNMINMFDGAASFNQAIGNWDVSNVYQMSNMFSLALSFNQSISDWDVSNVAEMFSMFDGAESFNQPLGSWDVSTVSLMYNMFRSVNLSIENYDSLLNGWASLGTLQPGVNFNGGGSHYCNGETARSSIINTFGWTITDGGLDCDFIGDANGDNVVDTLDILGSIDYIFGNPPSIFYFNLADVNFDDTINILDVLGIQDIILNPTWRTINTNTTDGLVGDNYLIITNDEFTQNTSETIEIRLNNDAIVKGMQFDFVLPEGFTLNPADITGTTRLNGFDISTQEISENTYKVLVYSLSSATVASGTGAILNIPLFIDSNTSNAVYPIAFTDVIVSDTINTDVSTIAPSVGEITFDTLGVDNLDSYHYDIKLYPNPVENILSIDSNFEGTYIIYDLNGRHVGKGTILLGKIKVDASFMQSGLYFIKINTDKGVVIKKLMKK